MPIDYDYDTERRILSCNVGHELLIAELAEYLRAARNDARIEPRTVEIVSLEEVREFAIKAQDIQGAEPEIREYVEDSRVVGSIFYGATPLQVGVGRMLSGMLTAMFPDYPAPVVPNRRDALEAVPEVRGGVLDNAVTYGEDS